MRKAGTRWEGADRRLLDVLHGFGRRRPAVAATARTLSLTGEHAALWLAAGLAAAAADRPRRGAWLRATALTAAAHLTGSALKHLVRRPRPVPPGAPPHGRAAGPGPVSLPVLATAPAGPGSPAAGCCGGPVPGACAGAGPNARGRRAPLSVTVTGPVTACPPAPVPTSAEPAPDRAPAEPDPAPVSAGPGPGPQPTPPPAGPEPAPASTRVSAGPEPGPQPAPPSAGPEPAPASTRVSAGPEPGPQPAPPSATPRHEPEPSAVRRGTVAPRPGCPAAPGGRPGGAFRPVVGRYAFPSSHAASAAAAAVAFAAVRPGARWAGVPVAAAMCLSRLVLGVHHPTDVLAGALLGAVMARVGHRWAPTPVQDRFSRGGAPAPRTGGRHG
ncbi:phosphatase PAP2 family protein [Streptomyces lavendulocolor]|uniref:phosphatase PAP2 family protein n=1 Tax=Streptomyces lavendulocolor TaxID=67316 RepID=UPI003C2C26A5